MFEALTSFMGTAEAKLSPTTLVLMGVAVYFAREFSTLSQSLQELNKNVAVLIERTSMQANKLDRMDDRITFLETR